MDSPDALCRNILIRADSSSQIGLGHIMRDIVLAQHYSDAVITFACRELEGNIINRIPYPVHILSSDNPKELSELTAALNIDMVVFDHYGIDARFERQIKEQTGVIILSLDDTYQPHYCDILLNHNISADTARYKELVPVHCELRCGAEHTLIRNEFKKEKQTVRKKIYDLFVSMGGSDPTNTTLDILKSLDDSLKICVVTTSANPHLNEVERYVQGKKNIMLHVDSDHVAKLLHQSRSAIITPSVMVHEVLFMDIPFIAIKTASNQDDMVQYLHKNGYCILETFDPAVLSKYSSKIKSEKKYAV
jgi:UDP-2,4-diacetamido-2,4,6-trideoxy-beta-L-altropyranose hydrolase